MGRFEFNKDLPEMVSANIRNMENTMISLYKPMVFFREELDSHTGKAIQALKTKMTEYIVFFGKVSSSLLLFGDTIMGFVSMVSSTDDSYCLQTMPQNTRTEHQMVFSDVSTAEEIKLSSYSLKTAAKDFSTNIDALGQLLGEFNTLLNNVIFDTHFPWDDLASIWAEGKQQISFLVEALQGRVAELESDAEIIIKELERVDNVISKSFSSQGRQFN